MGKTQQGAHYKRISIHRAVDVLYDAVASGADVLIAMSSSAFMLG